MTHEFLFWKADGFLVTWLCDKEDKEGFRFFLALIPDVVGIVEVVIVVVVSVGVVIIPEKQMAQFCPSAPTAFPASILDSRRRIMSPESEGTYRPICKDPKFPP